MTKMNWEKAKQRDRMRRTGGEPKYDISSPKRASEKQVAIIFRHKMLEFIPTEMSMDDARAIISAFAETHGWNDKK